MLETSPIREYKARLPLYLGLFATAIAGCGKPDNSPIIDPIIIQEQTPVAVETEVWQKEAETKSTQIRTTPSIADPVVPMSHNDEIIDTSFGGLPDPSMTQLVEAIVERETEDLSPEIQENISASTVLLTIDTPDGLRHRCSGIHIGDGKIVTADHCFGQFSPDELKAQVRSGGRIGYKPVGISNSEGLDVAIVKIENFDGLSSVPLGNASDLQLGDTLFATSLVVDNSSILEYAYNAIYAGGIDVEIKIDDYTFKTNYKNTLPLSFTILVGDNTLQHGFSGSGVFNSDGELVGVLFAAGVETLGVGNTFATGLAIRSEVVQELK